MRTFSVYCAAAQLAANRTTVKHSWVLLGQPLMINAIPKTLNGSAQPLTKQFNPSWAYLTSAQGRRATLVSAPLPLGTLLWPQAFISDLEIWSLTCGSQIIEVLRLPAFPVLSSGSLC